MDNSLFGHLSPELRNRIYELSLANVGEEGGDEDMCLFNDTAIPAVAALNQVCRQIRSESRTMFFALNRFVLIWSPPLRDHSVAKLLQLIGADALVRIRKLLIGFGDYGKGPGYYCPLTSVLITGCNPTAQLHSPTFEPTTEEWMDKREADHQGIAYITMYHAWRALRKMGLEILDKYECLERSHYHIRTWYVRKRSSDTVRGSVVNSEDCQSEGNVGPSIPGSESCRSEGE